MKKNTQINFGALPNDKKVNTTKNQFLWINQLKADKIEEITGIILLNKFVIALKLLTLLN